MSLPLFPFLNVFSALAFLLYGFGCVFTEGMKGEFERFGLSRMRVFVGVTQILGAAALLAGFAFPWIGLAGAAGLALQMLAGLGVRIRIGDGVTASLQACVFLLINLGLTLAYFPRL